MPEGRSHAPGRQRHKSGRPSSRVSLPSGGVGRESSAGLVRSDLPSAPEASLLDSLPSESALPGSDPSHLSARQNAQILSPSHDKLTRASKKVEDDLRDIENDILHKSLSVVSAAVAFAEVDEHELNVPEAWIEQYGLEEATRRFRIAKGAWRSTKEAPNGILVAMKVATSIVQARSTERAAPKALNVTWINNTGAPAPAYPELIVESE